MRYEAFVLKKTPYKEYDQVVVCYTKDFGKQIYYARSSLKASSKQGCHFQVPYHLDFGLVESKLLPTIVSACTLQSFPSIQRSLPAMALVYLILECFDVMVFEDDADPILWDFLHDSLYDLEARSELNTTVWSDVNRDLQAQFVSVLGYSHPTSLEYIAQRSLKALQFLNSVIY